MVVFAGLVKLRIRVRFSSTLEDGLHAGAFKRWIYHECDRSQTCILRGHGLSWFGLGSLVVESRLIRVYCWCSSAVAMATSASLQEDQAKQQRRIEASNLYFNVPPGEKASFHSQFSTNPISSVFMKLHQWQLFEWTWISPVLKDWGFKLDAGSDRVFEFLQHLVPGHWKTVRLFLNL